MGQTLPLGATAVPSLPEAEKEELEKGGRCGGGSCPSTSFPAATWAGGDGWHLPALVVALPLAVLVLVQEQGDLCVIHQQHIHLGAGGGLGAPCGDTLPLQYTAHSPFQVPGVT